MGKLKILKSGKTNIDSTDISDFAFHSDYPVYKIISSGSADFTMLAGNYEASYTITHNLGYIPMVLGFAQHGIGGYIFPCNMPADMNVAPDFGTQFIYCYADENTATITVHNQLPVDYTVTSNTTFTAYWRIMVDEY
jgi:hypothetical protein